MALWINVDSEVQKCMGNKKVMAKSRFRKF